MIKKSRLYPNKNGDVKRFIFYKRYPTHTMHSLIKISLILTCGLPLDVERSMAGRGSRGSLGVGLRGRCACAAAIFTERLIAEKPGGTPGPIALTPTPPTPLAS